MKFDDKKYQVTVDDMNQLKYDLGDMRLVPLVESTWSECHSVWWNRLTELSLDGSYDLYQYQRITAGDIITHNVKSEFNSLQWHVFQASF